MAQIENISLTPGIRQLVRALEILAIGGIVASMVILIAHHSSVPEKFLSGYSSNESNEVWEKKEAVYSYPFVSAVFYAIVFLPQTLYVLYLRKHPPDPCRTKEVRTNHVLLAGLKAEMTWYAAAITLGRMRLAIGQPLGMQDVIQRIAFLLVAGTILVLWIYNLLPSDRPKSASKSKQGECNPPGLEIRP